ncbi:protein disulfide-isomerase A5 [Puma concolor]|uniref:Protein disulfide-isomerase A5 n=1 Tax=Puma concolor TaxID=9696 RepID=A0A6P6H0T5_PUMCO|nr:protein disulfide-isomerase A5 [Puma concolor]
MRLRASGAKSTPGGPQPSLAANYDSQQAPLPGRLFQPRAHALADVAPGTRRRGAAGKWPCLLDPAELRAREPEWRTEPAVGSGGGDGAGRAGMAAAAADSLGEAVALGSGRGRHVRPTLGSALPAPGPRGTCGELPPNPGVVLPTWLSCTKVSSLIERISDPKDLKKLLRTRNNVLVLYSKSEAAAESHLRLLSTVAQAVKGQGTICWVDCGDAESRKLCKKMKVDLSPKDKKVELFHYQDGAFHTEYNRAVTFKSIVAFLKDPKGPPLWEEDPGAKDVVHIDSEKDFRRLLKKEEKPLLMMFYAPWCSVCKRIMPHFQKAATQLRGHVVLAGMNVYPSEFENVKEEYNVRGYPTICYFEKGRFLFQYDNYGSTAEDIVEWLKNPQPPQPQVPETPWADEGGSVYHLTDEDFDQFVKEHSSVLVMFHAPWCGHCKKMKPEFENAAEVLHGEADSSGVLAAVDATVNKALAERFHISEFPTLKYFKNGEKYAVPALRTKKNFIEWMRNPEAPPPPEPTWEEQQTSVLHLVGDNFRETLKKKKHTLVMFYAPWCPHCKKVIPHFTATANVFKDDRKIACAAVDCVRDKNQDLCQQEAIKAYPTFHYYHYGKFAEKYDSDRTELGFTNFIRTLREGDHERLGKKKEEL